MLMHAYGCIGIEFMMDVNLYVENIIIHVLNVLHVVLILYVTCYSMKWHNCISYARGHRIKSGVCAWYWLFTILGECVVSSKIRTTSKIETHGCIK